MPALLHCLHSYVDTRYNPDEDRPVGDWKGKKNAEAKPVAQAYFEFGEGEAEALFEFATEAQTDDDGNELEATIATPPDGLRLFARRSYGYLTGFSLHDQDGNAIAAADLPFPTTKYRNGPVSMSRALYPFRTMNSPGLRLS